jgi:hypothetical protein
MKPRKEASRAAMDLAVLLGTKEEDHEALAVVDQLIDIARVLGLDEMMFDYMEAGAA